MAAVVFNFYAAAICFWFMMQSYNDATLYCSQATRYGIYSRTK
jgi:hypothetical protein